VCATFPSARFPLKHAHHLLGCSTQEPVEAEPTPGISTGRPSEPAVSREVPALLERHAAEGERLRAEELGRLNATLVSEKTLRRARSWVKRCVLRTGDRFLVHSSELLPSRQLQVQVKNAELMYPRSSPA
jgi:hypothetical protein